MAVSKPPAGGVEGLSDAGDQKVYVVDPIGAALGNSIEIPGGVWLLRADFARQGSDLLLTGADGTQVLVRGYFLLENPPDLVTEGGQLITANLAVKLAGPLAPGQYAQAAPTDPSEPIGKVVTATGTVQAIRADGTRVTLAEGDPVYQGDVLETTEGAAIGIEFADDSTFSLGENGRMVLDEMVYDPGAQEGSFKISLVQGAFSFISGEIAKTGPDAMLLTTPVATIGIRGTTVAGRAAAEGEENVITLLSDSRSSNMETLSAYLVNPGWRISLPGSVGDCRSKR